MNELRVSVTTLEAFRYAQSALDVDEAEVALDELAQSLRSTERGDSIYSTMGTAVHEVTAKPNCYPLSSDGRCYIYSPTIYVECAVVEALLALRRGEGFCEMRVDKLYDTVIGEVRLSGIIDHWYGDVISDIKTIYNRYDLSRFLRSAQWQFYLDMSEAKSFEYHIMPLSSAVSNGVTYVMFKSKLDGGDGDDEPERVVTQPWKLTSYPYEGMTDRCLSILNNFLSWAKANDLLDVLTREERSHAF